MCRKIAFGQFLILGSLLKRENILAAAVIPRCMFDENDRAFPIDQELDTTTSKTL